MAHGMLTLSLITYLGGKILRVRQRSRGINYGSNKVRFTAPVLCGARIRLHRTLEKYEPVEGGARLTFATAWRSKARKSPRWWRKPSRSSTRKAGETREQEIGRWPPEASLPFSMTSPRSSTTWR